MMFSFYVENRIPGDGGSKSISKLYINHIAVNKLCFGNYVPRNFKLLLRLVDGNQTKTFFNDEFGNSVTFKSRA